MVTGAKAAKEAPWAGEEIVTTGGLTSVDCVAGIKPDCNVAGCIPISANRFTVACCISVLAGKLPLSCSLSNPHDH